MSHATEAQAHLKALLEHPMHTIVTISKAAKVDPNTLRGILRGTTKPRKPTADRILAVTTHRDPDLWPATHIDATATREHLQAIYDLGYAQDEIAEMVGMRQGTVGKILRGQKRVTVATHDRVLAVPIPGKRPPVKRRAPELLDNAEHVRAHLWELRRRGGDWASIGRAVGLTGNTIGAIGRGQTLHPRKATAEKILAYTLPEPIEQPKPKVGRPALRKSMPWGEIKRHAIALHRRGATETQIATTLGIPIERVRDALATSKGPRAVAHGWPPAANFHRTRNQGRAA